jgi:tetratricopeptide (TPR) repeat protein
MPGLKVHLDDFTLLRLTARDLESEELSQAERHLSHCTVCESALARMRGLDDALRRLAAEGGFADGSDSEFAPGDVFQSRPVSGVHSSKRRSLEKTALGESERGTAMVAEILEAAKSEESLEVLFAALDPKRAYQRFGLLYALQEAGRRSAENPFAARRLAVRTVRWLRDGRNAARSDEWESAERLVPALVLRAQSRLLQGVACLWNKDYSEARTHFAAAYRSFARGGADVTSLAAVELAESQRRGLAGEGAAALTLARRARQTFEEIGLEDYAARGMVAEGLALSALGRPREAVTCYRDALPVFEKYGLWSNSVGALNSAATALLKIGELDAARREFARALRRFSRESHRYWLGYLRTGLAEVLFAAGHYAEGAVSAARAARIFEEGGLRALMFIAMLLEVECWARSGNLQRARHRLELFWTKIERDGALDRVVVQKLEAALTGADPTYERLSSLRRQVNDLIQEHYRVG